MMMFKYLSYLSFLILISIPSSLNAAEEGSGLRCGSHIPSIPDRCIISTSKIFYIPPVVLKGIWMNEGGEVGMASPNRNGTFDLGPMQINTSWIRKLPKQFKLTARQVKNDPCMNIAVSGMILRYELNAAGNNIIEAVGNYHTGHGKKKNLVNHKRYTSRFLSNVKRLKECKEKPRI